MSVRESTFCSIFIKPRLLVLSFASAMAAFGSASAVAEVSTEFGGFLDSRLGARTVDDPYSDTLSLGESRLQLGATVYTDQLTGVVKGDLLFDAVDQNRSNLNLETGRGVFDLREAYLQGSPTDALDIKFGRQILTWGTGDLVFINDLFPKDWNSFFSGRDQEYLKAPSDALLVSLFPGEWTVDLGMTPRFDADRFINGERFSFYSPLQGGLTGEDNSLRASAPDEWFADAEYFARLARTIGSYELAVYGYDGFWKSPGGFDLNSGQAIFPKLSVVGASLRGPLYQGIANLETGYYHSREDTSGTDPLVNNSEFRFLAGYSQEVVSDLSVGLQYYIEQMLDYTSYRVSLPSGMPERDEMRHLLTWRVTQMALQQNLMLSFFVYFSPTDSDVYARPYVSYKASDEWLLFAGGNIFGGRDQNTFFGQFDLNDNVYTGARYSF
ncbi:MAG: hypothetical protein PHC51_01110 [bacterium]|nr:hypothetical protein [bacterium]